MKLTLRQVRMERSPCPEELQLLADTWNFKQLGSFEYHYIAANFYFVFLVLAVLYEALCYVFLIQSQKHVRHEVYALLIEFAHSWTTNPAIRDNPLTYLSHSWTSQSTLKSLKYLGDLDLKVRGQVFWKSCECDNWRRIGASNRRLRGSIDRQYFIYIFLNLRAEFSWDALFFVANELSTLYEASKTQFSVVQCYCTAMRCIELVWW